MTVKHTVHKKGFPLSSLKHQGKLEGGVFEQKPRQHFLKVSQSETSKMRARVKNSE